MIRSFRWGQTIMDAMCCSIIATAACFKNADPCSQRAAKKLNRVEILSMAFCGGINWRQNRGPLIEERLWGTCFIIEAIHVKETALTQNESSTTHNISGQIMSLFRDGCRKAFKVHSNHEQVYQKNLEKTHDINSGYSCRLVEAYFKCSIQCNVNQGQDAGDELGKLYSVLSKKRAQIVTEDLIEGTSIFSIETLIPVAEAFGLSDDLRKKTSGNASAPQLIFSHFDILPIDPFKKNKSQDDLEEFGATLENDLANNLARKYLINTRKRKGLAVEEKIVVSAEKQRTLTKMK